MNALREKSVSLWQARHDLNAGEAFAPLREDTQADVIVVGGGIAGLSIAYELSQAGQHVVLVDRGRFLGGMTSRTTAHLASSLDDWYHLFARQHGKKHAHLLHSSQRMAIDRIEEIVQREGIDCNFSRLDGVWFAADKDGDDLLQREIEACRDIGIEDAVAGDAQSAFPHHRSTLVFRRQGRFDPIAYCRGLISAMQKNGVRMYEDTVAHEVEEDESGVQVRMLDGPAVRAHRAVFATNSPVNDTVAIHTKQAPYRTYVVTFRASKGTVPDLLLWDTLDPYHYVRLEPDRQFDWLIVGGEDHKTGTANDAEERFAALERWARGIWPELGEIGHRWSGQVMEPVDDAPFLGRNPGDRRIFVITGDSGQGMTNGVAGSIVVRDLIVKGGSVYEELFDPGRKPVGAALEYMQENLTAVKNMADRFLGTRQTEADELQPGQGAVIRHKGENVAAWRSPEGTLSMRSAVCTHVGCLIQWNGFEQCWDCPCHGSHFSATGEAINAPAIKNLKDVTDDQA
jgi:glycine/D-amino acid oxidase-like deaminating enzyme/nitrite reductase/ring-hydroxylating ferredoxin subunit